MIVYGSDILVVIRDRQRINGNTISIADGHQNIDTYCISTVCIRYFSYYSKSRGPYRVQSAKNGMVQVFAGSNILLIAL